VQPKVLNYLGEAQPSAVFLMDPSTRLRLLMDKE
jgi:hypothetical protein